MIHLGPNIFDEIILANSASTCLLCCFSPAFNEQGSFAERTTPGILLLVPVVIKQLSVLSVVRHVKLERRVGIKVHNLKRPCQRRMGHGANLNDKIVEFPMDKIGNSVQFPRVKSTSLINDHPRSIPFHDFTPGARGATPRIPPVPQTLDKFAFLGCQTRHIESGANMFDPCFLGAAALNITASSFDVEIVCNDDFAGL